MCGINRWILPGFIVGAFLILPPNRPLQARIFYRAQDWLTTSPEAQHLLIRGTLGAWEQLVETAENQGSPGQILPIREQQALRLLECVHIHPGLTLEQVRQAIQLYANQHPEEIFTTFGDLAARALADPCR